jgi:hypothetical protein
MDWDGMTSGHSLSRASCVEYLALMANFKRKGPKSTRAGCLLCKPQKRQGQRLNRRVTFSERRRAESAKSELALSDETSAAK